jgi:small-conductance mechanosensitive channel
MLFTNITEQFKTGEFANPGRPLGALLYGLAFALIAWLLGRMLHLAVRRVLARDTQYVDRTTINFLAQLARFGVYLFAFISYAHVVPSLAKLGTAWLASVSVISVIFGMAAQNTLGNLIAGISLLLYRPFKVGDRLQVAAPTGLETGVIESLDLGYTVLKTDDNRRVVVPNSSIASQTTINLSSEDPQVLSSIPFAISNDSDIDKARAVLVELARKHPNTKEVSGCPVTQIGPGGVVLTLIVRCADAGAAGAIKPDLLEQAHRQFTQAGIQVPFPHTVVTLLNPPGH